MVSPRALGTNAISHASMWRSLESLQAESALVLADGANAVPDANGFLCTQDSTFSRRTTLYSRTDCLSSENMFATRLQGTLQKNQKLRQAESVGLFRPCPSTANATNTIIVWFRKPERRAGR